MRTFRDGKKSKKPNRDPGDNRAHQEAAQTVLITSTWRRQMRMETVEKAEKPPREYLRGKLNPRYVHGMTGSPEWYAWKGMRQRCNNPSRREYRHYGGRGIRVCDRWTKGEGDKTGFECFFLDMGRRPSPDLTVERKDVDGDYEPKNCCWATRAEQTRNRRVVKLNCDAVRIIRQSNASARELAKLFGCVPGAISNVRSGFSWKGVAANDNA